MANVDMPVCAMISFISNVPVTIPVYMVANSKPHARRKIKVNYRIISNFLCAIHWTAYCSVDLLNHAIFTQQHPHSYHHNPGAYVDRRTGTGTAASAHQAERKGAQFPYCHLRVPCGGFRAPQGRGYRTGVAGS